ncbi:MAG: tRNA (adenosine(37)-N6)-threonylcarbamoyltransferase complex ATPase subunit type 1 TsaE, partial [Syntrophomonadaceae bacterium]|nr:tRNA (adenosine(37)-N6)-threonylcarbamoyltransferase complex ATPase subunit type 1 TsaE [Syntrophomonadaceae bacterium]
MLFCSNSPRETRNLGRIIGTCLLPGDTVCLTGELGSGKTVLVQGVAEGLKTSSRVTSPTFALMHQYPGRLLLLHLDLYRLESDQDLLELGGEEFIGRFEFLGQPAAAIIEWAERIAHLLPDDYLEVLLEADEQAASKRRITLRGQGE